MLYKATHALAHVVLQVLFVLRKSGVHRQSGTVYEFAGSMVYEGI